MTTNKSLVTFLVAGLAVAILVLCQRHSTGQQAPPAASNLRSLLATKLKDSTFRLDGLHKCRVVEIGDDYIAYRNADLENSDSISYMPFSSIFSYKFSPKDGSNLYEKGTVSLSSVTIKEIKDQVGSLIPSGDIPIELRFDTGDRRTLSGKAILPPGKNRGF